MLSNRLSIKIKLAIALLGMAMVPLGTLGAINYFKTTDIFTKSIQNFLFDIARSKEAILENYLNSTMSSAQAMAETDIFQNYLAYSGKKNLTQDEISQRNILEKQVENIIYSFQKTHWNQYHHVFLTNKLHKVVVSPNHGNDIKGSPSSHLGEDTSENKWASQALANGVTTVSDFSSWVESDHNHQMLFFPIKGDSGETKGVLGFELQIPYEQEILSKDLKLGDSGHVYLTTTGGVPIVYKNMKEQLVLDTPGIKEAKKSGFSSGIRVNAEGVEVIDLYLRHDKYPWILVAEIETEEAFQSLKSIQKSMTILALVTFLVVIVLALLLSNLIVSPIKRLTSQIKEVSLGKFDIAIDGLERKDEIGELVRAFNRIVISLKMTMKNFKI